jgi:hypothetical protein
LRPLYLELPHDEADQRITLGSGQQPPQQRHGHMPSFHDLSEKQVVRPFVEAAVQPGSAWAGVTSGLA